MNEMLEQLGQIEGSRSKDLFPFMVNCQKSLYTLFNIYISQINFREMLMTKPNKRMIRRSFQDGLWVQYKTSPHQVQFHAKVNRVQVCEIFEQ